ncbi:unnamed protein product [Parajaminaea phylloscopi]
MDKWDRKGQWVGWVSYAGGGGRWAWSGLRRDASASFCRASTSSGVRTRRPLLSLLAAIVHLKPHTVNARIMAVPNLLQPPPLPSATVDRITQKHLQSLYLSLRRGKLRGTTDVALATAMAFRRLISGARFSSIDQLTDAVRITGAWLQEARRGEQAVTNVTLRTLHLIAEEAGAVVGHTSAVPSRSNSSFASTPAASTSLTPSASFGAGLAHQPSVSSPLASPAPATPSDTHPVRPPLYPRDSKYFGTGSTFSISDLVAAGQNTNSVSLPGTGANSIMSSGTNTPALTGHSSGFGFAFGKVTDGLMAGHAKDVSFASFGSAAGPVLEEDEDEEEDEEEIDEGEDDDEGAHDDDGEPAGSRTGPSASGTQQPPNAFHLKPLLIQAVQELIDELESNRSNIARDARDHIHGGEVVLTLGHSLTVEAFLKQAARDRSFSVIVADGGRTPKAASQLAAALPNSIRVVSVPHSSIHTLLPRVTKVILSPHTVLANGGLLAPPGSSAAALAARLQSTPVLALAGLHKVCGDWRWVGIASSGAGTGSVSGPSAVSLTSSHATSLVNSTPLAGDSYTCAPQSILPFTNSRLSESVKEVLTNEWDYVEPSWVDVLITNTGEYPGSYVYRLIAENFAE